MSALPTLATKVAIAPIAAIVVLGAAIACDDKGELPPLTPTRTEPLGPSGTRPLATPFPEPAGAAATRLAPLPPPLAVQLGSHATAMQFLGWTQDGLRFCIRATHGYDMVEPGGQNLLALVQVHDSLTGSMIDSFRIKRSADSTVRATDRLSRAWKAARPRREWRAFRTTHRLVGRDSAAMSRDGAWQLSATPVGKPPLGTKQTLRLQPDGIETLWTGFDPDYLARATRLPVGAPRVRISARRGRIIWPLVTFRPAFDYDQIQRARIPNHEPSVEGQVRAHWSPAGMLGTRIALVIEHEIRNIHDEHGPMTDARWLIRAPGPQIHLIDAGFGDTKARAMAVKLAAAGLAVATLTTARAPSSETKVEYRGDHRATAQRAADVVGRAAGSTVAPIARRGWATIVIVLGTPSAPLPRQ